MKRFLGGLLEISAGIILLVMAHELVLRFLPVARAPAVQLPTAADPIQRYAANQSFTWSLGWNFYVVVHGRTNAQGFVADYDYRPDLSRPTLAVIGDSMVESLMVPYAETLTGRLQTAFGDKAQAISISQSGSPLSQYIAYAVHACATYRPQRMVVIVVNNDFDQSVYANRIRDGIYHLHPRPDSGFDYKLTAVPRLRIHERLARQSALALYLVRNVGIHNIIANMGIMRAHAQAPTPGGDATSPARIAEGQKVIEWFINALPQAACLPPSEIVIVVDAIRPLVDDDGQRHAAQATYFGRMRAELLSRATTKGFVVVDAEPIMRAEYMATGKPFEFPTDMHWNSRAHAVIAAAVRQALALWP